MAVPKQSRRYVKPSLSAEVFKDRINFVLELAKHLHTSGTSVNRLEDALDRVANMLDLEVSIWSNPTGIMISFLDNDQGEPYTVTRVLRLQPGETNLGRLAQADAIAEQVVSGQMDIQEGLNKLRNINVEHSFVYKVVQVLCYGLASAMVVSLFPRTGWADFMTAAILGMLIGFLVQYAEHKPRLYDALEALAAFLVTLLTALIATYVAPLSLQSVIISALIILMPGLMLTLAVNELASQHLASGSARFAGALTVLMKLTFGSILASQVIQMLGWQFLSNSNAAILPYWMPWLMLLPGSFALATLFKTNARDVPVAMAAVLLGFGMMKLCSMVPGLNSGDMPTATFLSAFVITAVSNVYARVFRRPGALIRVPGIILLVPGSLGFRTINVAFAQDVTASLDLAFAVAAALIALVAGILFGNLLVSSRRNL